jgi:hypothetical protein
MASCTAAGPSIVMMFGWFFTCGGVHVTRPHGFCTANLEACGVDTDLSVPVIGPVVYVCQCAHLALKLVAVEAREAFLHVGNEGLRVRTHAIDDVQQLLRRNCVI